MATLSATEINAARNNLGALLTNASTSKFTATGDLNTTGTIEYSASFISLTDVDEDGNFIFNIRNTTAVLESESFLASVSPDSFVRLPDPEPTV